MEFDLEDPLSNCNQQESDDISSLFIAEKEQISSISIHRADFDASVRREIIALFQKVRFSCNFDSHVSYLAVNYFDRFVSKKQVPRGKQWILKLVAISCLSLAAKMKQNVISLSDLQSEEGFRFDSNTICRMELVILGALKWRMRSITPFSFLSYFVSLFILKDPPLLETLKDRAREIIFMSQNEINPIEYKPSTIAASALLSASYELFPLQFKAFRKAIDTCVHVNKENLLDCCKLIETIVQKKNYHSASHSRSDTPVSILDRHDWSSASDKISDPISERLIKSGKEQSFQPPKLQLQHC